MSTVRELYYTPLCDTDLKAYLAFIFACVKHGTSSQFIGSRDGSKGHRSYNYGLLDNGGSCTGSGASVSEKEDAFVGACGDGGRFGDKSNIDNNCIRGSHGDSSSVIGLAVSGDGVRDSGTCGGVRYEFEETKHPQVGCGSVQVGGPNLERNRENRRLKRERKLKRQSMNQDWRKRDKSTVDPGVSVGGSQGFWNSCSPEVRQQLIDSKAEWHIAENKRRAREEVAKLEKSTSVQAVVKQVLDTVKLANELKKNTKDEKIGGWAETVADSLNKSVAESVPSSLPSLESVGYGEAAIGRGGLSTPQTSNSEYDEVCQKLADKESICEKLNLRISELETKQLVSDGEMKKVLENEKNVEKRLFEAEIDKIKLRHYSSDIFCDDFLQRDIDMFTRDYKKKQQQKKKNKGS